ncbi:MAG: hypothetical protein IPJ51_21130 [Saprospiraceae bacterium]|nr:hypothetical protein [Saprospiraceae bacterium]
MDKDNKNWKDTFNKLPEYQAPVDNDLFWKIQFQNLPRYTTSKPYIFESGYKHKMIFKGIILLIFLGVGILALVYFQTLKNSTSEQNINEAPIGNYVIDQKQDDIMNKTFENFCLEYLIICEDLYKTDIAQRWNENHKSYQMTLEAIEELGETDFLMRQLTYLRINQTEMVSEIINNI